MKIACIQETKLNASSKSPSFPNYAIVRRDRPVGGGGGLITLVHHSIPFVEKPSPLNDPTETILIEAEINSVTFVVANVYLPPQSLCPPNFSASLLPILVGDYIVVGDINGHNELWSAGANDIRGDSIADELDTRNAVVLNNPNIYTRPISSSSPPWFLQILHFRFPGTPSHRSTPTICPSASPSTAILLLLELRVASPTFVKPTGQTSNNALKITSLARLFLPLARRAKKFGAISFRGHLRDLSHLVFAPTSVPVSMQTLLA